MFLRAGFTLLRAASKPQSVAPMAKWTRPLATASAGGKSSGLGAFQYVMFAFPAATAYLGTWQYQRLQSKEEAIREAEEGLAKPPLRVSSAADLKKCGDSGEYRLLEVEGTFGGDGMCVGPRMHKDKKGSHLVSPFTMSDGSRILVLRGWVPSAYADDGQGKAVSVQGVVRKSDTASTFVPANSPTKNSWFSVNVDEMAQHAQTDPIMLEVVGAEVPGSVPVPKTMDTIAQFHVSPTQHKIYMGTWYTLTVCLLYAVSVRIRQARSVVPKPRPSA